MLRVRLKCALRVRLKCALRVRLGCALCFRLKCTRNHPVDALKKKALEFRFQGFLL